MGVNYVHCFRGTSLKEFHNGEEDNKRGQGRAFAAPREGFEGGADAGAFFAALATHWKRHYSGWTAW